MGADQIGDGECVRTEINDPRAEIVVLRIHGQRVIGPTRVPDGAALSWSQNIMMGCRGGIGFIQIFYLLDPIYFFKVERDVCKDVEIYGYLPT